MQRLYIGTGSVLATCSLKWHPETNISAICLLESYSAGPGKSERLWKTSLEGSKLLLSAPLASMLRAGSQWHSPSQGSMSFRQGDLLGGPLSPRWGKGTHLVAGSYVAPSTPTHLYCSFSPICALTCWSTRQIWSSQKGESKTGFSPPCFTSR